MAESKQDKELNTLGFTTAQLRAGIVTTFIGLLVIAVIALWIRVGSLSKELVKKQDELYRDHIDDLKQVAKMESKKVVTEEVIPKVDSMRLKVDTIGESAKGAIQTIKEKLR